MARELTGKLEDVVVVLLLPAFFAFTGHAHADRAGQRRENWLLCGLIIVVASAGKFGGTLVAARLDRAGAGATRRRSAS